MGFVLSRRWLIFFVLIAFAAWGAYALGQWQFHRLHEKRHSNHVIQGNLAAAPVPIDALLHPGKQPTDAIEWRRVTVTGTWDDAHTVVVKYQTNAQGAPGADVATPLVTDDGRAVVVDRGWIPTDNVGSNRPETPPAQDGKVTVTGWVRVDAVGSATRVYQRTTRALSSEQIAPLLSRPVYGGFLDLARESPPPPHRLGPTEMPDDTGDGPHFFYGLQWWFFGALAVFGFFFLMYDEWQRRQEGDPDLQPDARRPRPRTSYEPVGEATTPHDVASDVIRTGRSDDHPV